MPHRQLTTKKNAMPMANNMSRGVIACRILRRELAVLENQPDDRLAEQGEAPRRGR